VRRYGNGPSTAALRLPQDSSPAAQRRAGSQSQTHREDIPGGGAFLEEEKTEEDGGNDKGDTVGTRKAK